MYILFEMKDKKLLNAIEIKGRWLEFCVGYIPDTHVEIIPWKHLDATILSDGAGQAWMFTQGWNGQISVRAGTPQDEQLVIHESTEDESVKVKYDLTTDDANNCVEFMKAVMRKKLDKVYDVRLDNTNLPPSKLEGESWAQQQAEANAYTADNTASTPLLSALATARSITVAEMVTKVNTAIQANQTKIQQLLSAKQQIEKSIKDCSTMIDCWLLLHSKFNVHAPVLLLANQDVTDAPAYNL